MIWRISPDVQIFLSDGGPSSPRHDLRKHCRCCCRNSQACDILFERPHIASVAPGTELVYKFVRKPSDEKALGLGFTDNITVKVESDGTPGKKNVLVQMYSGDRAREPERITDMDGNPMLVVYLDGAVSHFRQLAGGDAAYLKGRFKKFLGDGATIAAGQNHLQGSGRRRLSRDGDTLCE